MTDFLSGLKAGLAAHDQAEAEKREITSVIAELGNQALAVTDNTVTAKISEFSKARSLSEMIAGGNGGFLTGPRRYDALCFELAAAPSIYRELATWEDEDGGYPVRLAFDGQRFACHDRASLEQTLMRLITSAAAGKALAELTNIELPSALEGPIEES